MRFLNAQPLRRQIVVTTGVWLLLLVAAIVWSANRTTLERQVEIREEAASVATLAAAYLNQYFDGLDAMASVLVRHPAVMSFNQVECGRLFAALIAEQPLLVNVTLRDSTGLLRAWGAGGPDDPGAPTEKTTISQAYPVAGPDGDIGGELTFSLNLMRLENIFRNLALPDGSAVSLLDAEGRILARSPDGERYIGRKMDEAAATEGPAPGGDLRVDVDGVERFVGAVPVERGPWSLTVGIPRSIVLDRVVPLWSRNLAIVVSSVLFVLGLSLWLSHHTSNGLNNLRAAAQRIASGDLSPPARAAAPNQEVAELQDAFITMAANLRAIRDALDRQVEQERKMRETVQSLQRQVVRQERLAAVGLLVSGVAHELNNPLQAILGTAELLERSTTLDAEVLSEIGVVKTQSNRACEIIRSLSRFGSQQPGAPTLVDLRQVIAEVIQLRRLDLEKAAIAIDVNAATSAKVHANLTELEQVTLNFVINAQQAIESAGRERGRILIRLSETGRKVRLEVQDDGPGVTPEHEPKLFQPFFTTKPVGKGTGLGLSVSYGIIDSYGGVIGCHGNEWHGATFFFELPAAEGPPGEKADVARA